MKLAKIAKQASESFTGKKVNENSKDKIADISSGTVATLIGLNDYKNIDKFKLIATKWQEGKSFKNWGEAYEQMMSDFGLEIGEQGKYIGDKNKLIKFLDKESDIASKHYMGENVSEARLSPFVNSYIETALWSSTDESDEAGGEPMDKNYSVEDIAPETIKEMQKDCDEFQKQAGDLLDDQDDTQVAHDFWLTRNGHGAGFWDGDYEKELGKKLTDLSKKFGEYNLYVGDDGMIYGS